MAIWFIISSVIIFTSANRFILVVSLISVISIYLSNIKLSRGFLFNVTIFSVLSIIFSLNIISILNYLLDSMSYFGIYSMGLQRLLDSLNAFSNGDSVISGRGLFYLDTLSLIMSNPFGLGPINGNNLLSLSMERSYDSVMLAYPHNFFLELYLHYGIFGGTFVLIIIGMIALYNVKYRERIGSKFYLYLMMSCLSISLLTSSSYLFFSPFWISLALGLNNINKVLKT
ncbi:TPA: O-antigen ligase family protein [Photobacterium damselae]